MKDEIHPRTALSRWRGCARRQYKAQLARKLRVQLLVFVAHVVLLFLIARKNANLADVAVQKCLSTVLPNCLCRP